MTIKVKVSGAWKDVSKTFVKVGGAWKEATAYVKVGGAWKLAGISPMTATDWGVTSGTSPHLSASRAVTVPAGNPGQLRFEVIYDDNLLEYSINGAAYASVVDGATPTITTGQTLRFRFTGGSFDGASVEVYDNTTGTLVGSWLGSIT